MGTYCTRERPLETLEEQGVHMSRTTPLFEHIQGSTCCPTPWKLRLTQNCTVVMYSSTRGSSNPGYSQVGDISRCKGRNDGFECKYDPGRLFSRLNKSESSNHAPA